LASYTRQDARQVSVSFLETMKSKSARGYLTRIGTVFNKATVEWGLGISNPFVGIELKNEGRDSKDVLPFTLDELKAIASSCVVRDDDVAWVAALQMNTGARIQEITKLRVEDVVLDAPIPHIKIQEHYDLGRSVKTSGSNRDVPLLGMSLWAASRALSQSSGHHGWLFRFGDGMATGTGGNRVNDWLKPMTKAGLSSHSFRHGVITRLTLGEVNQGLIDQIAGHASKSMSRVASGYFGGWPLAKLWDALQKIAIPAPSTD
jgi:integrase